MQVKCNAVRALGNLLKALSGKMISAVYVVYVLHFSLNPQG